ncbi:MAG: sigma 54-interacting transcriptional regulator [Desulfitobacteriaceae bacterium]|nr:sigma 54-interacting transcriptional regulator [Desulfitobacteriaceae bacterium]
MQTTEDPSIASIIGNSPQILDLKQAVLKIAPRNTTVLLTGETGTGKELFAQALHQGSLRRFKPFVRVNCAAIPENLLESELFGYAEGTFTGGKKGGYLGKFAIADGGTVFLDELAELPLTLQAKLLRFLQEHEIQRLGESIPRRVNVRVVAATNANLAQLVKYKKFRSDLYYRLNVVTLEIPPLRNRREDIPLLCQSFLKPLNAEYDYRVYRLSEGVKHLFDSYPWPGNVRELHNALEAAFYLFDGGQEIQMEHLPQFLRQWHGEQVQADRQLDQDVQTVIPAVDEAEPISALNKTGTDSKGSRPEFAELLQWQHYASMIGTHPLAEIMNEMEAEILRYLLAHEPNRSHLAEILGISRQALYKKMHKYFV